MAVRIVTMEMVHYPQVHDLWARSPGIGRSESDSQEAISAYLDRNPGMSKVALDGDMVVGAALCGHDGRRGYLHHLAVAESHRRSGVGRLLEAACMEALAGAGVPKCHLFVFKQNSVARMFWAGIGWGDRADLCLMSKAVIQDRD